METRDFIIRRAIIKLSPCLRPPCVLLLSKYFCSTINRFSYLIIFFLDRFPDRDDQTVFWIVARRIRHPTMQHIGECPNYTRKDDIHTVHHLRYNATNVVACALDPCMFSSGMVEGEDRAGNPRYSVLKYFLHKKNSSIYSVHANWIIGSTEKMLALKNTGLWIAKENVEQSFGPKNCLPFVEKAGTTVRSPSPSDRGTAKHTQHASHSSEFHTTHDSSRPPSNSVPLKQHVRINLPVH